MKNKLKIFITMFLIINLCILNKVHADMLSKARIGNEYYDTLEEAILNASSNDTIILTSDSLLDDTIIINKNVNINLNNHDISADEKVFLVQGGSLNLSGKGTIKEKKPYYGAIVVVGSENLDDVDYSTLSVSKDITLEGWSGIFIDHSDNNNSSGVLINMNGNINALNDVDGDTGIGVYVNGNIKHDENAPIINLSNTVNIKSTGFGIYSAGNANYYINGAHIEGVEAGIGIKSGMFKILDGEIFGTGPNKTPTEGNNNGINASGTAIQIESNAGYYGNIELDIRDGLFQSKESYVIYEYTVNGSSTQIKEISLSGGDYVSLNDSDVFKMSDSFNGKHKGFISGGNYSSSPSSYLIEGHSATLDNNMYVVVNKEISNNFPLIIKNNKNNNYTWSIVITTLVLFVIIIYINRTKVKEILLGKNK